MNKLKLTGHFLQFLLYPEPLESHILTGVQIELSFFCCSLSLQASRECQRKEKLLEQKFRAAFREFQQWLVNAKINTAKCFDAPQNLSEASSSLQKIQVLYTCINKNIFLVTYVFRQLVVIN